MTWRFISRKRELNSDFRLKIASSVNSPRDAPRPKIAWQTVEPGLEGRLLAQLTSESGRLLAKRLATTWGVERRLPSRENFSRTCLCEERSQARQRGQDAIFSLGLGKVP